jgi:hypothetical protein
VSTGPADPHGATSWLVYGGSSTDGSRVFYETSAQLVSQDTDTSPDIYERAGGVTTLISTGPAGGNGNFLSDFCNASADGSRVFFETSESLVSGDTDTAADVYERSGGTTTLISTGPMGGGTHQADCGGISADGSRVFFETTEQLVASDSDLGAQDVYERAGGTTTLLSTGLASGNYHLTAEYRGASADGAHVVFRTSEQLTFSDLNSRRDVYERFGGSTELVSTGPTDPNTSSEPEFFAISNDGARIFFTSSLAMVSADTDFTQDVYERSGGTTTLVSGNGAAFVQPQGISPGGSHVYFFTTSQLTSEDTDSSSDVYEYSGGTITLISTGPTSGSGSASWAGSSADASRVFFSSDETLVSQDTDVYVDIYERSGGTTTLVSTGPAGGNGAFPASFTAVSADGSRVFFVTNEPLVSSDTDTHSDVYERSGGITTRISRGPSDSGSAGAFMNAGAISADGSHVFFQTAESLVPGDTDPAAADIYEASIVAHPGYLRPKGASPLRVSLVPAYESCTASNRMHGPPLAFGSCNPPTAASPYLTAGTPDANGATANFAGFLRLGVAAGIPGPPDDSDVAISASLTDVRCQAAGSGCASALADYTGELLARFDLRMTDRFNDAAAGGGTDPGTALDSGFAVTVPCTATAGIAGASCAVSTTANAVAPGVVIDGKRAIWDVGAIRVDDGGPDGIAGTAGNSLFATQGVFVP